MSSNYVRLSSNTVLVPGSVGNATAGNQAIEIQKLTNIDNEGQATNLSLMSIDSKTPVLGQQLAANSSPVVLTALQLSTLTPLTLVHVIVDSGSVSVSNFPSVQPVNGTVTANIGTTNGLALDTSVNSLLKPSSTLAAITTLGSITGTVNVAGTFFQATQPVSIAATVAVSGPLTDTQLRASPVAVTGTVTTTGLTDTQLRASPVPVSGTVTANIGTTNGLALDTSVNSLLKPSSTLAAVTTLGSITGTVNVAGTFFQATQPVSIAATVAVAGTVTANIGTTNGLALDSSVNSLLKPSSTLAAVTTLGSITGTVNVAGTFFQATQPVSGPLTDTQLRASPVAVTGTVVTGGLTDTQLRASPVAVSLASTTISNFPATQAVTGTFFQATQPVSNASLPLPAGASTEATLAALNTKFTTTANGVKVDGSATTQPISAAALPLPAGASTSAAQSSMQTTLTSIDTKTPTLGQALAAASQPVVLTALQLTTLTPLTTVTVTQATGSNLHTVIDSGVITSVTNTVVTALVDGLKPTYVAVNTFVAAAAATDIFTISGSATKTIRITKIGISGTQTTGNIQGMSIIKRSALNTGGTSVTITAGAYDTAFATTTAVSKSYTANPTALGAQIAVIRAIKIIIDAPAGGGFGSPSNDIKEFIFGLGPSSALVLRGVNDLIAINLGAVTLAGNSLSIYVEYTEE